MHRFARLFEQIDATTSTTAKVEAMAAYFREAPPDDAAWALFFLSGQKIKRLVTGREVARWAMSEAEIPEWLFGECYSIVGDLAETVSLLIGAGDPAERERVSLAAWVHDRLQPIRELHAEMRAQLVIQWFKRLDQTEIFLVIKLLTGEFRVGVSRTLVTRALALASGLDVSIITDRLMGDWQPTPLFMKRLFDANETAAPSASRPYPFFLASPLEAEPSTLGERSQWLVEWKWDGIRAQIIRRAGQVFIWSRGEELVTDRFPEIVQSAARLPTGCVLDGEILAFRDDRPLPFAALQRRIGRQKLSPALLAEFPVTFTAFDLLEYEGQDIRERPLSERRSLLEALLPPDSSRLRVSDRVDAPDWEALGVLRAESRDRGVEGFILKQLDSAYGAGRTRGPWWKWKIAPYTIDAVLVYAQPGHGRRANLLTDYTFAVHDQGELVPFAKAYSGLNDEEIKRLDRWIRANTIERFGPVRSVKPVHVFELAFEAIAPSPRHRSGVAVRFPRIARWREDKTPEQADTLDRVKEMMNGVTPT